MADKTTGKLKLWIAKITDKISDTINIYLSENFSKIDDEFSSLKDGVDEHKAAVAPHSGHETPAGAQAKVDAHANRTDNPHSVTKSQVGLGNVANYGIATQAEAEAGTSNSKYMTPQRTSQAINALQAVKSVAGKTGIVTLFKSDVGLSNVDNVQQASKVEFDSHNNDTTRHITSAERTAWNNKSNLILGETSSTAYRGDRGKIAYDHSQTIGNPHQTTKADIGLSNVENYGIATQTEAEAGSVNNKYMTPLRVKQAIDVLQAVKSVAGKIGNVTLTKDDVGLSNVDNVKQASKTEFDSHNNDTTRHITAEERTRWNNKAEVSQIPTKVSELENDANYVTQEELGDAGYGDMMKAVYDTDNDGKVDMAEAADSVPWTGVTGKPSTFPPSSHTHTAADLPKASTSAQGIVQLIDSYTSTSTSLVPTAKSLKQVYEIANSKSKVFVGTTQPTDADIWFEIL